MLPKGHKDGCKCPVCKSQRKKVLFKKKPAKKAAKKPAPQPTLKKLDADIGAVDKAVAGHSTRLDKLEIKHSRLDSEVDVLSKYVKRVDSTVGHHDNRLDQIDRALDQFSKKLDRYLRNQKKLMDYAIPKDIREHPLENTVDKPILDPLHDAMDSIADLFDKAKPSGKVKVIQDQSRSDRKFFMAERRLSQAEDAIMGLCRKLKIPYDQLFKVDDPWANPETGKHRDGCPCMACEDQRCKDLLAEAGGDPKIEKPVETGDKGVGMSARVPFCEVCAVDHHTETPAIALAPQTAGENKYRWVPVCEDHLADWFLDCEDFPEAVKLGKNAERIWINPPEDPIREREINGVAGLGATPERPKDSYEFRLKDKVIVSDKDTGKILGEYTLPDFGEIHSHGCQGDDFCNCPECVERRDREENKCAYNPFYCSCEYHQDAREAMGLKRICKTAAESVEQVGVTLGLQMNLLDQARNDVVMSDPPVGKTLKIKRIEDARDDLDKMSRKIYGLLKEKRGYVPSTHGCNCDDCQGKKRK